MTLFRAGGYGYHWTPCGRGGGNGAAIITVIIAVLVIGGGGMGAAASALTSLLVTILVILCAVAVLGITVAVVVVRRSRRRDAQAGVLWRPVAPGAVTAEPVRPQVTATERPAIAAPQPVIINIFGADERAAALIRQALPAATAEIITEGEESWPPPSSLSSPRFSSCTCSAGRARTAPTTASTARIPTCTTPMAEVGGLAFACRVASASGIGFNVTTAAWYQANLEKARGQSREAQRRRRAATPGLNAQETRRWREANPERHRQARMRLAHGPDFQTWFTETLAAQDGCCYLCDKPLAEDDTNADHDHACCPKGKSCSRCRRGLACTRCNTLIGLAEDNPALLRCIAAALESAIAGGAA